MAPLNRFSTKNGAPSCVSPATATASTATASTVPQTLGRPGPDGGGAEQRAGKGRQHEFLADRALPDLKLRLQDNAGEGSDRAGGDEGQRDIGVRRDAGQLRGARAVADDVEIAAERQIIEHDPQDQSR